jgi:hypothetical protein
MLTFAYQLVQTTKFEKAAIPENFAALEAFSAGVEGWTKQKNYLMKRGVKRSAVRDFIAKLSIPYGTNLFTKQAFISFLDKQHIANSGYADKWTIVCASNDPDKAAEAHQFTLAGQPVAPLRRQIEDDQFDIPEFSPNKHNLLNPGDQAIDINLDEITPEVAVKLKEKKGLDAHHDLVDSFVGKSRGELAYALTLKKVKEGDEKPARANGSDCRLVRSENEALLIIYPFVPTIDKVDQKVPKPVVGIAVSFAASDNVAAVEYVTNSVFERDMLGIADIDDGYYDEDEVPTAQLQD